MAGKKENLAPMWKILNKHINLDPATKFDNTTYLGCTQRDVEIPDQVVQDNLEVCGKYLTPDDSEDKVKSTDTPLQ